MLNRTKNKKNKFPARLAVIDLGTNSVRYDIYELTESVEVKRLHREKVMIRLGDGLYENGKLDASAMERTEQAFAEIKKQISKHKVMRVVAFATSALRDSPERNKILSRIRKENNIDIKTLSGEEEARLIAKGVLNHVETPPGFYTLIDIGGGSTEMSLCYKKNVIDSFSFNLGASRLQQTFLKTCPPQNKKGKNAVKELRSHIWDIVTEVIHEREWPTTTTVIGSSGTIRAFKRLFEKHNERVEPFEKRALSKLVESMEPMGPTKLLAIPGMDPKRVDIILAGGILLDEIMNILGAKEVLTSKYALRDGMLDEEIEKIFFKNAK